MSTVSAAARNLTAFCTFWDGVSDPAPQLSSARTLPLAQFAARATPRQRISALLCRRGPAASHRFFVRPAASHHFGARRMTFSSSGARLSLMADERKAAWQRRTLRHGCRCLVRPKFVRLFTCKTPAAPPAHAASLPGPVRRNIPHRQASLLFSPLCTRSCMAPPLQRRAGMV